MSDTTLILFNYPLDYEIKENGNYYHDPEVPKGKPTYHYTSVPIDYGFPADVAYKVLEEVYIPSEDGVSNGRTAQEANALEQEAFRITGNLPEGTTTNGTTNGRTEALTWRPSGRLRVWDDIIGSYTTSTQVFSHWEYYDCGGGGEEPTQQKGVSSDLPSKQPQAPTGQCRRAIYTTKYETHSGSYIPLEGILVRMHTFVKIAWGTTNTTGNYSSNLTFLNGAPVQYSLVWETTKYRIYNELVPALHNGPLQSSAWNWDNGSGKQLGYATIHRAGYRYHWKDIGGLKRPGVINRLLITYKDTDGTGIYYFHYWQQILQGLTIPNIRIWSTENGMKKLTNRIFATTTHELGHASQTELMKSNVIWVNKDIFESWAEAVEWHITRIEYEFHGEINYDDTNALNAEGNNNDRFIINGITYHAREHKQWWTRAGDHDYTPVFIDMVDAYNQDFIRFTGPNDGVTGYTMGGIEGGFLENVYNLGGLRTQLQANRPGTVTWGQVDTYMNYYNW